MNHYSKPENNQNKKSLIFDIYRGTSHDGPGLRTTVFFKGCPLCCTWCQNPEGIKATQELWWDERTCIGCLLCHEACVNGAIRADGNGIGIDASKCKLCGACTKVCPSTALAFTGREWLLDQLVSESLKDIEYYKSFGGGVTASGGEPLLQYGFIAEFFKRLQAEGVHTALDTCGFAPRASLKAVLPFVDCVLFDLKIFDLQQHKRFTGQPNKLILDNACYIAEYIRSEKKNMKLWIRTPLIPEVTAVNENIAQIAGFIVENCNDVVEQWEFCAFNSICAMKYKKMGIDWLYKNMQTMPQQVVHQLRDVAISAGFTPEKLAISGFTSK